MQRQINDGGEELGEKNYKAMQKIKDRILINVVGTRIDWGTSNVTIGTYYQQGQMIG